MFTATASIPDASCQTHGAGVQDERLEAEAAVAYLNMNQ
jgi:hypothetical protein